LNWIKLNKKNKINYLFINRKSKFFFFLLSFFLLFFIFLDITHEEEFSDYLVDKLMEMPEIDPEMV
jgi:hypothetical protein